MEKVEIKMHFKKLYVKIVKWVLPKNWLSWQRLNWYRSNQHTIIFFDKCYEKSPNVVAVAIVVGEDTNL